MEKVKTSDLLDKTNFITKEQQKEMIAFCKKHNVTEAELKLFLEINYEVD